MQEVRDFASLYGPPRSPAGLATFPPRQARSSPTGPSSRFGGMTAELGPLRNEPSDHSRGDRAVAPLSDDLDLGFHALTRGAPTPKWPIAFSPYIELAASHPIATNCNNGKDP